MSALIWIAKFVAGWFLFVALDKIWTNLLNWRRNRKTPLSVVR